MSELGNLLRELRGKRSLRSVSEKTGLSHTYISDIEKGYRRGSKTPLHPSADTLRRFAEAYDYSYKKLMIAAGYWEEEEEQDFYQTDFAKEFGFTPPSDDDERVFFQDFHKMTKEEKEEAIRYIEFQREKRKKDKE